ncbi:cittilin family RiPP precursor [Streptomyces sp. NPDC014894]|uniref:cittilin family RiPP precursor n=1 Tax=Streptomyces sp. NPDC014894 TaxID=3364931 RepID=UPI0036F81B50
MIEVKGIPGRGETPAGARRISICGERRRRIPKEFSSCTRSLVTPWVFAYSSAGGAVAELRAPVDRKGFAMRKMILTGALFARLTRKDRLTLPYAYY